MALLVIAIRPVPLLAAGDNTGALIGWNTANTLSNVYWDTQTSGLTTALTCSFSCGNVGSVTGLTTAQLQGTAPLPNGVTFSLGSTFSGGAAGGANGVYPAPDVFLPERRAGGVGHRL